MISWNIITHKNISTIHKFVIQHEYYAVYAAEHIRQFGTVRPRSVVLAGHIENKVIAVILLAPDGMLHLLFNPLYCRQVINTLCASNFYRTILARVNALYGHPDNTAFCYTIIKKQMQHRKSLIMRYGVYTNQHPIAYHNIPPIELENTVCSLATIDLIDNVYQLHKEYLIEEVLIDRAAISKPRVYKELSTQIHNKAIMVARSNGVVIAKCAVNACGIHYHQIGGVYTMPMYRHKKVAAHLVSLTTNAILKKGKKAMLFVNQSNNTAKTIYQKLGYSYEDKLSIIYLHS